MLLKTVQAYGIIFLITDGDFFFFFDKPDFKKKIPRMQYISKRILCKPIVKLLGYFQSWSEELRHLGYIF